MATSVHKVPPAPASQVERNPRRSSDSLRVHRTPLRGDGCVARPGLRHAALPRKCIAVRHGIWRPAMEYAEVVGAAFGAFPHRSRGGTGRADARQGPRRSGLHRSTRWCAEELQLAGACVPVPPSRGATTQTTRSPPSHRTIYATPAASLAVSVRANVKAVQRMLGHAKASMTLYSLDTYADLFDEDLDEVADRLDDAIRVTADALRTAQVP